MAVKADACFPLCLPFLTATSPVKKAILENPQIFQNCKLKNIFSADYAQSNAERIQNRAVPGRGKGTKNAPPCGGANSAPNAKLCRKERRRGQFSFLP